MRRKTCWAFPLPARAPVRFDAMTEQPTSWHRRRRGQENNQLNRAKEGVRKTMGKRIGTSTPSSGRMTLVVLALAALSACGGSNNDKKYAIGGNTSGLNGTLVLQNNGADNLTVTANGAFTFNSKVKGGGTYAVTVATQPAGQTCVVSNGSGTANANVTNIAVTCTANATYNVGGAVSGLGTGLTVVLRNNGSDNLAVNANGVFTFGTKIASGLPYAVTVFTQPAGQTCTVTQGTGTVSGANVTSVAVACTTNPPPAQTYTIGGSVSGLAAGTTVVLQNNLGDNLARGANGAFTFATPLASGANYQVSVLTQPSGQTCAVTNGSGAVAAANVSNVSVGCSAVSATFTIGGTITGLKGAGLKIEDTAANVRQVAASETTFTLPNPVGNNFEYNVGISQQPLSQTCVLLKSHGVVNGANVTNIDVRCVDNVTTPIVGTYTIPALSANDTSYVYMTLFADGVYIYGSVENHAPCGENNGNGVEYGVYNYNLESGQFTIKSAVVDTNGACGLWDSNGSRVNGPLSRTGSGQSRVLTLTTGMGQIDLVPVESTTGQIVGSWSAPYEKNFVAFLPAGGTNLYTFWAETQADSAPTSTGQLAGVEYGCALTTALTGGTFTPNLTSSCLAPAPSVYGAVDTNGTAGISSSGGPLNFTVSVDLLTAGESQVTRIKPN
jgi:hypothetical protein